MVYDWRTVYFGIFSNSYPFVRYVALISGLGFGDKSQDLLSLQMFSDLVTGELGSVQVRFI